jgi:hypothetical protein
MSNTVELSVTAFVISWRIKKTANPKIKIEKDSIHRKNFRTLVQMLLLQRGFHGSYNITFYKKSDKYDLLVTAYFPYPITDYSSLTIMSCLGYDFILRRPEENAKPTAKPTVHIMSSLKSIKKEQTELLKFIEPTFELYEKYMRTIISPEEYNYNLSITLKHFTALKNFNVDELVESPEVLKVYSQKLYATSNVVANCLAYEVLVSNLPLTK